MSAYTNTRGRSSTAYHDTARSTRRRPLPTERRSTVSEREFDYGGCGISSLFRSNARAGNGKRKDDKSDHPAPPRPKLVVTDDYNNPRVRPKASTFSFVGRQGVNQSERALEGHDKKSFASRARQTAAERNPDRDSRPLSFINGDLGGYDGTPSTLLPSYAKPRVLNPVPGNRWREIDDDVRLSRFYGQGDLPGLEGQPQDIHEDWTSKEHQRRQKIAAELLPKVRRARR